MRMLYRMVVAWLIRLTRGEMGMERRGATAWPLVRVCSMPPTVGQPRRWRRKNRVRRKLVRMLVGWISTEGIWWWRRRMIWNRGGPRLGVMWVLGRHLGWLPNASVQ